MTRRNRYFDSDLRFLILRGERELPNVEDIEEIGEAEEREEKPAEEGETS